MNKLNYYIYELLVERKLVVFTINGLRDELIALSNIYEDPEQAKKFIYRQVIALEKKGFLKSEGVRQSKKYLTTKKFQQATFIKKLKVINKKEFEPLNTKPLIFKNVLLEEKQKLEFEMSILEVQIDEYKAIFSRYPDHGYQLSPLLNSAQKTFIQILGKINAFNEILNHLDKDSRCLNEKSS